MKNKNRMEFNLNDNIWVKLTQAGVDYCRGYWERLGGKAPIELTAKKHIKIQAWQFMEVLGAITHHGMKLYYELTILIDRDDLKEKK